MDFITKLRQVEDMRHAEDMRQVEDRNKAYYHEQKLGLMLNEQQCSEKGELSINDNLECNDETTPTNKISKFGGCLNPDCNNFLFKKPQRMKYTSTFRINGPRLCTVDYEIQKKNTGMTKKDMQLPESDIDFPITIDFSEESANADEEKDMSIVCQTLACETNSQACSSSVEQPGWSGVPTLKSTGTITVMNRDSQAAVIETKRNATFSLTIDLTSEDRLEALSNQVNNTGFILDFFLLKKS